MFDRNENPINLNDIVEYYDPVNKRNALGKVIDYNFDAETVYLRRMPRPRWVTRIIERSPISCRVLEAEEITMFRLSQE